jgi:transcription elongation factor Elf1
VSKQREIRRRYRGVEIHSCWWCGNITVSPHLTRSEDGDWLVFCGNCGGSGPQFATKIAAVRRWNQGPQSATKFDAVRYFR